MTHDDQLLEERLGRALTAVAERTLVTPRIGADLEAVRFDATIGADGRRHLRWALAAAAVVLAVVAGLLFLQRTDDEALDTAGDTDAPSSVPTSERAPAFGGLDAVLIVPPQILGLSLGAVGDGWRLDFESEDGSPRDWVPSVLDTGPWHIPYETKGATRTLTYRYGPPDTGAPMVWISVTAVARTDLNSITGNGATQPARLPGHGGLEFVDFGLLCPPAGEWVQTLGGWPGRECARRALGVGPDLIIELTLPAEADLDGVVAELRVGTVEELLAAVGPVDGIDGISPTAPVVPTTQLQPPPDTPFCNAWLEVLELVPTDGSVIAPEALAAMRGAAHVAPPALANQIRDLADAWEHAPAGSPGSAGLMGDVVNATWAECPGIQEWANRDD